MPKQLNARVPDEAQAALRLVHKATGIKIESLVYDGIRLLAGEADRETKLRCKMFRDICKRNHISVTEQAA